MAPVPVAGCIPDIPGGRYLFGDHYLRSDGELFYDPNGTAILVKSAATGLALLGITEVVQQQDHACGIANDGTAWCWPLSASAGNANGDLGNGSFGGTNLGIGVATQVVTNVSDAGVPSYLTGAVHISTASDTEYTFPTCVIRSDHTLWCWGSSTAETNGPDGLFWCTTGNTQSVDVATPIAASASDGGPPPTILADQISLGDRHACFVYLGKVSCWGQNVAGNLGIGNANLSFQPYPVSVMTGYGLPATVDEIGSGYDFSCARAGGSVWCWGTNSDQNIGNPGVAPSICNSNYCVPVPAQVQESTADGGLTAIPDAGTNQSPLVNAVSLYVGYQFACVIDTSGTIWCWGASAAGVTYKPRGAALHLDGGLVHEHQRAHRVGRGLEHGPSLCDGFRPVREREPDLHAVLPVASRYEKRGDHKLAETLETQSQMAQALTEVLLAILGGHEGGRVHRRAGSNT